MSPETLSPGQVIESLSHRAQRVREIEISGRGILYNFHHKGGIETRPFLNDGHLPRITRFDTVIVSNAFGPLREVKPGPAPVEIVPTHSSLLYNISIIANADHSQAYEQSPEGEKLRKAYLESMAAAAREFFKRRVDRDEVIVPVVRCGANIANKLGITGIPIEVKRLSFTSGQLGAGINLPRSLAVQFTDKRLTLLEGVVASGSTTIAFMAAIRNAGIRVHEVSCDSVIVCPEGAKMTADFRAASGFKGVERANFVGGYLDPNWYVRWHAEDILYKLFGEEPPRHLTGQQVLGDGGDLTTI